MRSVHPLPSADNLRERLDYDPETGALRWRKSRRNARGGQPAGRPKLSHGWFEHCSITIDGRLYSSARVIWKIMTGEDPIGRVEHLNLNRRDMRWNNLLLQPPDPDGACRFHRPPWGASGVRGVYPAGKRWIARLRGADSKLHTVGMFDTKEEAARAIEEWRQRKES